MRILCLSYTHTYSHLSRPMAVAQELQKHGHEVIFAGDSPKMELIRKEGFATELLYEPDPDELYGNIRSGKIRFVSEAELDKMTEADVALIRSVQPDIVLTDGRFSARLSVPVAGCPHVAIVNVSSTAYRAKPYIPLFQPVISLLGALEKKAAPVSGVGAARDTGLQRSFLRFVESVNLTVEMAVFDNVMSTFLKRSKQFGLQKQVTATNCLAGTDLTLLADIPEYFPVRTLPKHYHFVGPMVWSGRAEIPEWWSAFASAEDTRPFVYVCMGTTALPALFETVFAMMDSLGMRGVITTGGQYCELPEDHPDIKVVTFIDGELVLDKSAVVICHGGNGTIYQALGVGVPVVGIPTIPDQHFNMRRVEALGVGITVAAKEFVQRPAVLSEAVQKVLQLPQYTDNARQFASLLSRYTAPQTAAALIEGMVAERQAGKKGASRP